MYINASIKGAFGMSAAAVCSRGSCLSGLIGISGSRSTPLPTLLGGRGLCSLL